MAEGKWKSICRIVQRKRVSDLKELGGENLRRCLNCWDLTGMGVGRTLGVGVYVLVGAVALKVAGPSVVLSFLLAAIPALFAGLCYAELGARVPLAGSAFIYTYVTIGELIAFIVGWNNILEFIFASASVARGLSSYVDAMANHSISNWFLETMPVSEAYGISPYFDLFSFLFVLVIGILLAIGVRASSTVNNVFSSVNVLVIIFIVIAGAFRADQNNWNIPVEEVPPGYGSGGFFPYGVWGTLKGVAVCFYGFVGFDVVNASGEEVKEPRKTIPITILLILFIALAAYAAVSTVLTMMVPYYHLTAVASLSTAFSHVGWEWASWIITVGAIFGLSTSLFGALFPLPRLLYSMASDGLFLHWFAKVSPNRRSPTIATVVPTAIIALLAAFLELEQLVLMMCIGTLSSYTIVATCVVLLRYRSNYVPEVTSSYMKQIIGRGDRKVSRSTTVVINVAMFLYLCQCIVIAVVVIHTAQPLIPAAILHIFAILTVIVIALQPSREEELDFKTPLVPFIPCLSIYANVHLMVVINWQTWLRVFIWILLGIPIYLICICCYTQGAGKKESKEEIGKHAMKNGKSSVPVQIIVESPTPPRTMAWPNDDEEHHDHDGKIDTEEEVNKSAAINKIEEITVQQVQIENNEEKEAKIIDLLDQVLQAEEDTYGEVISLKESKEEDTEPNENGIPHRKSLSELSDAGSDASLGNHVLSKYDVIAQVHREDLPKVNEEEERVDSNGDIHIYDDEEITAFNESDTNSRTDESGYSDTIEGPVLGESVEDTQVSTIPVPPPLDEDYFNKPTIFMKFNTVMSRHTKTKVDDEELSEPRVSIQSNNSQGDGNIRFGSDRQIKFMSKLNDIFQKSIAPNEDEEEQEAEPRRRSHSTGNVTDQELSVVRDRPQVFLDLKKELLSREVAQNLRPVNTEDEIHESESEPEEVEDKSMSRQDLKHKLENIFAHGGPRPVKPRLMKSNPPTPEESYQTDVSSTESIPKMPKVEKNDTLKRQRDKFGAVLNSFRLSMNTDDEV